MLAVEEVGCAIPYVAEVVDEEHLFVIAVGDSECAFVADFTDVLECYAGLVERFLNSVKLRVCNLKHDSRVFGKEYLHHVGIVELVEADVHTTLDVTEVHFKQSGEETTG